MICSFSDVSIPPCVLFCFDLWEIDTRVLGLVITDFPPLVTRVWSMHLPAPFICNEQRRSDTADCFMPRVSYSTDHQRGIRGFLPILHRTWCSEYTCSSLQGSCEWRYYHQLNSLPDVGLLNMSTQSFCLLPSKGSQICILKLPGHVLGIVELSCHIMKTLPMSHHMDHLTSVQRVERRFRKACGCCCCVTVHGGSLTKSPDLKLRTGNTQPPEEAQICWTTESPRIRETDSWERGRRRSHSRWWQQTSGTQETYPHSTNSPPEEAEILLLLSLSLSLQNHQITPLTHFDWNKEDKSKITQTPNLEFLNPNLQISKSWENLWNPPTEWIMKNS